LFGDLTHLSNILQVHIIGISLGGTIGQLALKEPLRFSSLTLISTHPGGGFMPKFGSFQGAWGNLMLMVYGLSMTPHDLIKYLQLPTKPVQAFFPGPLL